MINFEDIYNDNDWYGNAHIDRCPGVRLLPRYKDFLIPVVVDLGCGRGHTVDKMNELGIEAIGYDLIEKSNSCMVGDITKPLDFEAKTCVCMDVIEHIEDEGLIGLFENFKKCERRVFSVHNGTSMLGDVDLHINKKPFEDWISFFEENGIEIIGEVYIHEHQRLFFSE